MINEAPHCALATLAEVKVGEYGGAVGTPDPWYTQGPSVEGHVAAGRSTDEAQLVFSGSLKKDPEQGDKMRKTAQNITYPFLSKWITFSVE
jgi:hypothetical protein